MPGDPGSATRESRKLDITGGAPELHPGFRGFVERARALGRHVMVRHNLTVQLDGIRRPARAWSTCRRSSPASASR